MLTAACTSSSPGSDANGAGLGDPGASGEPTTTHAPAILALTPDLDLLADECWAPIPPPPASTTTTTAVGTASEVETTTTAQTTPETLGEAATTVPLPTIIAQVDCRGTNEGKVFANFCLGANPVDDDPTLPKLVVVACETRIGTGSTTTAAGSEDVASETDGQAVAPASETPWPGDRIVRRAAIRLCLERFDQLFGSYALSELVVEEFVPTEGIWGRGLRNVVCWIENEQ